MIASERKIVSIDESKCDGCGLCVNACAEGAIQIVDGKARLVSDSYCDGLGSCLGPCPRGAISIITRKADAFDAEAAERHVEAMKSDGKGNTRTCSVHAAAPAATLPCGCPGSMSRTLKEPAHAAVQNALDEDSSSPGSTYDSSESMLQNWPVQLRLVPPQAPYLKKADILLAADCTAVAVPDFHRRFLRNRPVIIACPKLEQNEPQIEKLAHILNEAQPSSLTVLMMEVPCCAGLGRIAEEAIKRSGREVELRRIVIGLNGKQLC